MEWKLEKNIDGRPIYRCRIPYGKGVLVVGGVVDYSPADVPYYAMVRTPLVVDKWFKRLDDAKGFVVATYTAARIRGDM